MKCALVDSHSPSSLPPLLFIVPLDDLSPSSSFHILCVLRLPHPSSSHSSEYRCRCNGPADIFMCLFFSCAFNDSLPLRGHPPEFIFLPVVFSAPFLLKVSSDLSRSILLSLWKELNFAQKFPPVVTDKDRLPTSSLFL